VCVCVCGGGGVLVVVVGREGWKLYLCTAWAKGGLPLSGTATCRITAGRGCVGDGEGRIAGMLKVR